MATYGYTIEAQIIEQHSCNFFKLRCKVTKKYWNMQVFLQKNAILLA